MRLFLRLIFISIAFGCGQQTGEKPIVEKNVIEPQDAGHSEIVQDSGGKAISPHFDFNAFKLGVDSLFRIVLGHEPRVKYFIDTLKEGEKWYAPLFPEEAGFIYKNRFKSKDGVLQFTLLEAEYKEEPKADSVFSTIKYLANNVQGEPEGYSFPCLTYQNDYVIKSDKKIYWIDSGCSFTYPLHKKVKSVLVQSLISTTIEDSVMCKCGGIKAVY